MDKVTIPPEVVEAMAMEGVAEGFRQVGANEVEIAALVGQRMSDPVNWPLSLAQAEAAARAMLAAWPGAEAFTHWDDPDDPPHIILPIPQEASNG